jgi:hypothetical protein
MTDTAPDTAMPAEIASLVERLRINAESWRRDDALEARDESEGDLADEAATAILALQWERDEQWRRANVLAQQNAYHKDRAEAAEARVAELEKALEFYADTSKYPAPFTGGFGELYYDCGQIARRALEGDE